MRPVHLAALAVFTLGLAAPAAAQTGRVTGIVKDAAGKPIKGATVRASNPDAAPHEFTSTTDDKGRFAMLGLRTASTWHFVAEAPGFYRSEGDAAVRSQPGAPFEFTMTRDLGPIPGALARDIQQQLSAANTMRDEGKYDQAIAAYQSIQTKNPKLTSLNLVLAGTYREKAERETDATVRVTLLERASAAYADLLKDDGGNERAKTEMAAVTARLQELKKN
jgi:hypothetical protein